MKYTQNLNLKKPDTSDAYNIADFNTNADALDTAVADKAAKNHAAASAIHGAATDTLYGHVKLKDSVADDSGSAASLKAVYSVKNDCGWHKIYAGEKSGSFSLNCKESATASQTVFNEAIANREKYAELYIKLSGNVLTNTSTHYFKLSLYDKDIAPSFDSTGNQPVSYSALLSRTGGDFVESARYFYGLEDTNQYVGVSLYMDTNSKQSYSASGSYSLKLEIYGRLAPTEDTAL